jgi:hypothetical protein
VDTPVIGVLDTDVFRRGLDRQLRGGGDPLSLAAAQAGTLRLFLERRTLREIVDRKLADFAEQMHRDVRELKDLLEDSWLPAVRVVDVPPGLVTDPRVVQVSADDRPAAELASLLAPCTLLTDNHHHFRSMGVTQHSSWLPAAVGAERLARGDSQVAAAGFVMAFPFTVAGGGMLWGLRRVPVPAWARAGVALGAIGILTCVALRTKERRERAAGARWPIFLHLMEEHSRGVVLRESGMAAIRDAVLVNPVDVTPLSRLMRRVATESSPVTAAELWQELQPADRRQLVSVGSVRRILHETPVFSEVRRGRFLLGDQCFYVA